MRIDAHFQTQDLLQQTSYEGRFVEPQKLEKKGCQFFEERKANSTCSSFGRRKKLENHHLHEHL